MFPFLDSGHCVFEMMGMHSQGISIGLVCNRDADCVSDAGSVDVLSFLVAGVWEFEEHGVTPKVWGEN